MVRLSRVLLVALGFGLLVVSAVPASAATQSPNQFISPTGGHTQR